MAKKSRSESQEAVKPTEKSLFAAKSGIDASLDALFSKSAGPVKNEPRKQDAPVKKKAVVVVEEEENEQDEAEDEDDVMEDDEELSELDDEEMDALDDDDEAAGDRDDEEDQKDALLDGEAVAVVDGEVALDQPNDTIPDHEEGTRKRKRKRDNEDLEDVYLTKLAREQDKEQAERDAERGIKRTKSGKEKSAGDVKDDSFVPPVHESLAGASSEPTSLEQAARTVFLGNVSNTAITSKTARKALLAHLSSFLPSLPPATPSHKLESLRFRSTAFSSSVPKKAAFARKDIMDSTTKSTNAYAVYSTKTATREAAKQLNGTIVLDRHIRVDEVAHPQQVDHRRCVFVGNLGFVDDESAMAAAMAEADGEKRRVKKTPPGDAEEGLWREFGKAGKVESVRVVRDAKTRVGKGFAYVQFEVCYIRSAGNSEC
jgi:nucleolar protein 12